MVEEFEWILENDLAQPVNVISASNTASNDYYQRRCKEEGIKAHPARFPQALPEFVIGLCEVLAKEVGMTFVTGADVVMIVTTGEFTRD